MNYLSTGAGFLPSTVRSFAGGAAINTARWIHWTLMHGPSYCPRIMMSCCSKEHKVLPWQTEVHVGSRHVSHGSKGVYWHVPRFGCSFLAPAILTQILIMVSWTSILYWDPPQVWWLSSNPNIVHFVKRHNVPDNDITIVCQTWSVL